ncbi:hypothetical protein EB796_009832 [Bugula neritina]|uniref:Uncharacterized protein n=1 Tax=Bugula neritina TaxID=10212 RepID=A0A7J7K0R8_BUGNE|nr:hypothetical protein EB796_009832 [Bugula neritina]
MEGDSELHKTIVSMIWQKGMLGACVYNTDTLKLQLLQDIPEGEGFLSASQLLMQTQADIVITGAKQDSRFVQALTDMDTAVLYTDCTLNHQQKGQPHDTLLRNLKKTALHGV